MQVNQSVKERWRRSVSEKRGKLRTTLCYPQTRASGAEDGRRGMRSGEGRAGTRGRWDGVGELSGTGNCSKLLGDDDQVGWKRTGDV